MAVRLIGNKAMNRVVSHEPDVKLEVNREAKQIGARAESALVSHRKTGEAHIDVSSGDVDAYVSLVDKAGLSIEFGHWNYLTDSYTEGLYIITRAARLL